MNEISIKTVNRKVQISESLLDTYFIPINGVSDKETYIDRNDGEPYTRIRVSRDLANNLQEEKQIWEHIKKNDEYIKISSLDSDTYNHIFEEFLYDDWHEVLDKSFFIQIEQAKIHYTLKGYARDTLKLLEEPMRRKAKSFIRNRAKQVFNEKLKDQLLIVEWKDE